MLCSTDEWLWGWDPTPGIVSVWAESDGRATIWRRIAGRLIREDASYRPWVLLDRRDDVPPDGSITVRELEGPGDLRFLVSADDGKSLSSAILRRASQRLGRRVANLRDLGKESVLALPSEEQYLVSTGRTYFRDLSFDQLHRLQFDLETTGLSPEHSRIFMIAVRHPSGAEELIEASGADDAAEADLI